jgi:hypothetical protein
VGAAAFRAMAGKVVAEVTDTQCGFKFFDGALARAAALPLRTRGFAFDVELLVNCLRLGATVTEIPVSWRDVPGSTFSPRRHSMAAFRDVASIWLRQQAKNARDLIPPAPQREIAPRLAPAPFEPPPVPEPSGVIPAGATIR